MTDDILQLYRNKCIRCFRSAAHVHEITYRSRGKQSLRDKINRVPLCVFCHDWAHRTKDADRVLIQCRDKVWKALGLTEADFGDGPPGGRLLRAVFRGDEPFDRVFHRPFIVRYDDSEITAIFQDFVETPDGVQPRFSKRATTPGQMMQWLVIPFDSVLRDASGLS